MATFLEIWETQILRTISSAPHKHEEIHYNDVSPQACLGSGCSRPGKEESISDVVLNYIERKLEIEGDSKESKCSSSQQLQGMYYVKCNRFQP